MRVIALIVALFAAFASADAAHAHATLIASNPADRAVVARPPARLTLTFNEPVAPLVLRLVGASGHTLDLTDVSAENLTLVIRLPGALPRGTHLLSWRVISADGHPVGGAVTFSIGEPGAAPLVPHFETDRLALWAGRLGLYVALFIGCGGAFYGAFIARWPLPRRPRRLIVYLLACGLLAAPLTVGLQGADVLAMPSQMLFWPDVWLAGFATSFGATALIAMVAILLGLLAMRLPAVWSRWPAALALAGAGAAFSASGHAGTVEPQWLMRLLVFLHGLAVTFWIGALLPLRAAMRQGERRLPELLRFSRTIPVPVAILLVSGLVLAIVQVRELDALWNTAYGLVLAAKLAAVAGLLLLALANRALTPRAAAGDANAIRRIGSLIQCEIAMVLVILALAACWRFTPPPRALLAAAQAPVHVHIHTERAMADVRIEPPQAGGRQILVTVLNGEFGPLAAKEVTVVLAKPDAGIELLRLPATHAGGTTWRAEGVAIPLPGRWRLRVEILVSDFEKLMVEEDVDIPR